LVGSNADESDTSDGDDETGSNSVDEVAEEDEERLADVDGSRDEADADDDGTDSADDTEACELLACRRCSRRLRSGGRHSSNLDLVPSGSSFLSALVRDRPLTACKGLILLGDMAGDETTEDGDEMDGEVALNSPLSVRGERTGVCIEDVGIGTGKYGDVIVCFMSA